MIIKITPPDETKEAITIHPRSHDEVIIGECFNGFSIPTDIGMYGICMRDGGIEVTLTPHGGKKAKLVLSMDKALQVCSKEIKRAHSVIYKTKE